MKDTGRVGVSLFRFGSVVERFGGMVAEEYLDGCIWVSR